MADQGPACRIFEGARLAPCVRSPKRPARLVTRYGRHQSNGRPIRGWTLLHSLDTTAAIPSRAAVRERPDTRVSTAIYAGLYYGAFGHFLTETFPNLLAARALKLANPDVPMIFHTPDFFTKDRVASTSRHPRPHVVEFVGRLGIEIEDSVFIDAPIEIGRLLVPDAPFLRKFRYNQWLPDAIEKLFGTPRAPGGAVYLSRSRWPKPRIVDEPRMEEIFAAHGYDIVHPQDLDLTQQIDLVRGVRHLAGPQGTALHWSLYAEMCKSVVSLGWGSPLQRGICKVRRQIYVDPSGKRVPGGDLRMRALSDVQVERAIERAHR